MRDALRRLSERFRDRLKRFDYTHNTDKYVRVCVDVFLVRSHSFFLTYTKETSCLRIENNHFLFSSCRSARSCWLPREILLIGGISEQEKEKAAARERNISPGL